MIKQKAAQDDDSLLDMLAMAASEEDSGQVYDFGDVSGSYSDEDPDNPAVQHEKQTLINQLNAFKSKLKANGTGMTPSHNHTIAELKKEFGVRSDEVNARRAEAALKSTVFSISSFIELVSPKATRYFGFTEEDLDLRGFRAQVEEDYDDIYYETVVHLSIIYADYFKVDPHVGLLQCFLSSANACNTKNMLRREYGPDSDDEEREDDNSEYEDEEEEYFDEE